MAPRQSLPDPPPSPSPSSSSASRLLTLPAEIRIMILTMLLAGSGIARLEVDVGPHQRWLAKRRWSGSVDGAHITRSADQHSAQILRVSSQLHQEGLPILYCCNKFDLTQSSIRRLSWQTYNSPAPLIKRAIGGANLKLIRHVIVVGQVKLPAFISAFKGLQSLEVRMNMWLSDNPKPEELSAAELQAEVRKGLSDSTNLPKVLREKRDLAVKLDIDVYELLTPAPVQLRRYSKVKKTAIFHMAKLTVYNLGCEARRTFVSHRRRRCEEDGGRKQNTKSANTCRQCQL